ncbi:MAG: phosphoglycerate kinase [Patescibacteria group bacterium]
MRYLSQASRSKLRGVALLRLDFNAEDEWRMRAVLPTIKLLLRSGARILVVSHRGRPAFVKTSAGKPAGFDKKLSLCRDAATLGRMLGKKVGFLPKFDFTAIKKTLNGSSAGSVFVLENIRFLKGEETKAPELARKLAGLGDYYVNDAFAVCHRPDDSVARIEKFLPSYAGLELEKEIETLSRVMKNPRQPLVLIIGGAKAHDKLGMLRYFKKKADKFLMGGVSANTLLKLRGTDVGKSKVDEVDGDYRALRRFVRHPKVVLPVDYRKDRDMILDIGPKTVQMYVKIIRRARTIIWSGPMGLIEKKKFAAGNLAVARAVARNRRAFALTGGGETVTFLKQRKLDKKFSFISTGGSAMLEFLAGKKLPGIVALESSK